MYALCPPFPTTVSYEGGACVGNCACSSYSFALSFACDQRSWHESTPESEGTYDPQRMLTMDVCEEVGSTIMLRVRRGSSLSSGRKKIRMRQVGSVGHCTGIL